MSEQIKMPDGICPTAFALKGIQATIQGEAIKLQTSNASNREERIRRLASVGQNAGTVLGHCFACDFGEKKTNPDGSYKFGDRCPQVKAAERVEEAYTRRNDTAYPHPKPEGY